MLHELAQETLEYYGGFQPGERLESDYIRKWQGILPDSFLSLWREKGLGSIADGSLWFCRPEEFSEVLAVLFGADPDFSHKDCYVVAHSAFGKLYAWSERYESVIIDLPELLVTSRKLLHPDLKGVAERAIWSMLTTSMKDLLFDIYDADGKELYKRARKKLGALQPGEIYGFFPALAFGGAKKLENLQRVRAVEHCSILAQIDTPRLIDYKPWPPQIIRPIG